MSNLSRLPFDGPADQPADALPFDDQPEPIRHDAPLSRPLDVECEGCYAEPGEVCRPWCLSRVDEGCCADWCGLDVEHDGPCQR